MSDPNEATTALVAFQPEQDPHQERLDRAVSALRRVVEATALELAVRVGEVIVEVFYDGDPTALRHRGPKRVAALRALARRDDLPFSASTLYRCIGVYRIVRRRGGVSRAKRLTVSHYQAVLGLDEDHQTTLLERAETQRWTAAELKQEVRRRRATRTGGRPRLSAVEKTTNALRRAVDAYGQERDRVREQRLGPDRAWSCLATLEEVARELEHMRDELRVIALARSDGT